MGTREDDEAEIRQEEREEPMRIWIADNRSQLEIEWFESLPPEDTPLDDDIPDFLDEHADEFDKFCYTRFMEE